MVPKIVDGAIDVLLERREAVRAGELARALGISRQAAHRHLAARVRTGALVREGRGRASRYRRPGEVFRRRLPIRGLEEHRVLADVEAALPPRRALPGAARAIFRYAFTEMVNNAIEHSGAKEVELLVTLRRGRLSFDVLDRGVGVWERLRRSLALADHLEALQELSKGKRTTDPTRHTGEGIFFTSKAADRFELASQKLRWIVDNERGDVAVGDAPGGRGTRVHVEIRLDTRRSLRELFETYAPDLRFTKTRTYVKLFEHGREFVSRSEARRLLHGLDAFEEIVLDFAGVESLGQGFADEVFRVYPAGRPGARLVPVNMGPAVEFMVRRASPRPGAGARAAGAAGGRSRARERDVAPASRAPVVPTVVKPER